MVEFDADQSDQNTILLALDQILHLQPACSIVSKRIVEIDGTAAVGEDDLSSAETIARYSRSSATVGPRDGIHGDSYRPVYSERSRDQLLDSYRPGTVDGHGTSSRGIDSYRPNGRVSSDLAAIHPDGQQLMTRSDETNDFQNEGGGLSSSATLGTRYDALVEDMVSTPNSQLMTNSNSNNKDTHTRTRTRRSGSHYSPPPRRDRSASPQNARRRSERIRSAPSRNMSEHETSHKTKLERWKHCRDEEVKRIEAAHGSLEYLAPLFSDKGRFERQRESEFTPINICNTRIHCAISLHCVESLNISTHLAGGSDVARMTTYLLTPFLQHTASRKPCASGTCVTTTSSRG